jgi:phage terminase small subunit
MTNAAQRKPGKPRRKTAPARGSTLRINARVPRALSQRVQKLAKRDGGTVTDIVEAALSLYCATQEQLPSAFESFRDAGLIGGVSWEPDASVSTKKMLNKSLERKLGGKS